MFFHVDGMFLQSQQVFLQVDGMFKQSDRSVIPELIYICHLV